MDGGDITAAWSGGVVFTLFQGLDPASAKDRSVALWLRDWIRENYGRMRKGERGLFIPNPALIGA